MNSDLSSPETTVPCPDCGGANRAIARFCRQCGAAMGAGPAAKAAVTVPCTACGVGNPSQARFCRQCGRPLGVQATAPLVVPPARKSAPIEGAAPLFVGAGSARARPKSNFAALVRRPIVLAAAGLIALACLGLALFYFIGHRHPAAAPIKEYATRLVRVRNATNVATSIVVGALQRGDAVTGSWVTAADGQTQWLKIKWGAQGDGYVWSRNLSDRPRPSITPSAPGTRTATIANFVYGEPDLTSPVVENLSPGQPVATVGTTSDGWVEIERSSGGVGYVRVETFQIAAANPPPPDASAAAVPSVALVNPAQPQLAAPAQVAPSPAMASGATRYACAFAPDQSINPPAGIGALSFTVDEARSCINNRSIYLRNSAGGLKRTMLSDKDHRASVLYLSPDRGTFIRMDYALTPDAYANIRQNSAALVDISCAPLGDANAAATMRLALAQATPHIDLRSLPGTTWRRMVWRCSAAP
jgi:uncharacterized protein YgiM (DUF1202 family)